MDIGITPWLHQERYEEKANEITGILTSPTNKTHHLISSRSCVVICGVSGSGKTISIALANEKLAFGEQIAECIDLLWCKNAAEANAILQNDDSQYAGCKHVAYTIVNRDMGKVLSELGTWPVIFM